MGFRFRKSVKILPGVRINFGKKSTSVSLGGRGATVNIGKNGSRTPLGIPGTGLSWSSYRKHGDRNSSPASGVESGAHSAVATIATLIVIVCVGLFIISSCK